MDVIIEKRISKYKINCSYCDLYADELFEGYRDKYCESCTGVYYEIVGKDDIEVNLILKENN